MINIQLLITNIQCMSLLHSLTTSTSKTKKRVGRGYGSGKGGHTSSRGTKGQRSRGSSKVPVWFEGGQLKMIKRLPMQRGKGRLKSLANEETLQLAQILKLNVSKVDIAALKKTGVIHQTTQTVKVVGKADITKKIELAGIAVSQSVRTAIEKAGGVVSQ